MIPQNIPHKPLGLIKTLIETCGLDVSYVYDDLVFINHNAYLLQMGEQGEDIGIWFNSESNLADRPVMLKQLVEAGVKMSLNIFEKGTYSLKSEDNEESFRLEFKNLGS